MDHHHYFHFPPRAPGHAEEILTTLRELENKMATLQDTINELSADDAELAADVTALVNIINDIPARIQAAVVDALTKAGVDDATITAALGGVDTTVKAAIEAAKAVLPVAPTPGADTTVGTDTVAGDSVAESAGGADTVTGSAGDDSVAGG